MSQTIKITCKTTDSLPINELVPFQGALKTLHKTQFKKLKQSILKYGFSFPCFVWDSGDRKYIIDAHQRCNVVREMLKEGYVIEGGRLPVVYIQAKDEREAKEKVLAATSQYGKMQAEGLYELLETSDISFKDMKDVMEFPEIDLEHFEAGYYADDPQDAEPQMDRAEELNKKWQVKSGDLWQIGEHRLLCGDSTKAEDVDRITAGKEYCVLTDPPYNIGFEYNEMDDQLTPQEYAEFCKAWFDVVHEAVCLIFSPGPKNIRLYPPPRDTGYWLKRYASAGASAFNLRTVEPILIYGKIGAKRNFDLFDYSSGFTEELRAARCAALVEDTHAPAKPLNLWIDIMGMFPPDVPILDCFAGNGTSFIAAQNKKMSCWGVEIDLSYCAVILERMSQAFPELEIKLQG